VALSQKGAEICWLSRREHAHRRHRGRGTWVTGGSRESGDRGLAPPRLGPVEGRSPRRWATRGAKDVPAGSTANLLLAPAAPRLLPNEPLRSGDARRDGPHGSRLGFTSMVTDRSRTRRVRPLVRTLRPAFDSA
jgi:hypothetical protein